MSNQEKTTEEKIQEIKEYYSEPEKFWPEFWRFIHLYMILNDLEPDDMSKFIHLMILWIPCNSCRWHLIEHTEKNPYTEKDYLEEYWSSIYRNKLHNIVNSWLSKNNMSFSDMIEEIYKKTLP